MRLLLIGPTALVFIPLAVLMVACGDSDDGQVTQTSTSPETSTPTVTPTPTPPPATIDDIELGDVRLEPDTSDPSGYYEYAIVATIINEGNGSASGFNVGATYDCLPGEPTISGGLDIVQGLYIGPTSSFTYRNLFHYQCVGREPWLTMEVVISDNEGNKRVLGVVSPDFPLP